jgi:thymidylate kinase
MGDRRSPRSRLRLIRAAAGYRPDDAGTLRDAVLGDFRPDLTLYLDVTPEA